jgi:capsid protein
MGKYTATKIKRQKSLAANKPHRWNPQRKAVQASRAKAKARRREKNKSHDALHSPYQTRLRSTVVDQVEDEKNQKNAKDILQKNIIVGDVIISPSTNHNHSSLKDGYPIRNEQRLVSTSARSSPK